MKNPANDKTTREKMSLTVRGSPMREAKLLPGDCLGPLSHHWLRLRLSDTLVQMQRALVGQYWVR